jgi:hypothetical protein
MYSAAILGAFAAIAFLDREGKAVGFSCVVSLLFLSIYPRLELF